MTDVISNLLDMMRVRSTAYIAKNLSAPWGVRVQEHTNMARFHIVVSGSTWISVTGTSEAHELKAGDIAIVPQGKAHDYFNAMSHSERETKAYPTPTSAPRFEFFNKDNHDTHLLCGFFELCEYTPQSLIDRLPDILIGRQTDAGMSEKYALTVDLINAEIASPEDLSQPTLNRLTEMLCVYTIRTWLHAHLSDDISLKALSDAKTKLVLDQIHNDPSQPWTVDKLAKLHGQSRTAFAAHFKTATGVSPISYVRGWRIKLACRMLCDTQLSLDEIAFKSGYADTNAFNRAFKREIGMSPGAYRRKA